MAEFFNSSAHFQEPLIQKIFTIVDLQDFLMEQVQGSPWVESWSEQGPSILYFPLPKIEGRVAQVSHS